MIYSLLESAKVNGHNVYRYMAVPLTWSPYVVLLSVLTPEARSGDLHAADSVAGNG